MNAQATANAQQLGYLQGFYEVSFKGLCIQSGEVLFVY